MTRQWRRGRAEALLVVGSLLFLLAMLGVAEIAVRTFSAVDLLGNSRNLFVAGAFGSSNGNAPDVEAISFGAVVYTDEHGFRVPKVRPKDEGKAEAILILGDSVGFGPAVAEEDTFAGLLRVRFAEKRIYNTSVIGYSTSDYRNVVDAFVPRHDEIGAVVLVYCLNDVSPKSAQNIDRYLKAREKTAPEQTVTDTLRSFAFLSRANDVLRSRSKLYLFLRHRLLRTQMRDWKATLRLYAEDQSANVERAARDIAEIAEALRQRSIPLVVILSPFEYQLRDPHDPETQIPQRKLGDLLSKAGVDYIDARRFFDPGRSSQEYFLAYDPMHLSALGHRVIAGVIGDALERRQRGSGRPKVSEKRPARSPTRQGRYAGPRSAEHRIDEEQGVAPAWGAQDVGELPALGVHQADEFRKAIASLESVRDGDFGDHELGLAQESAGSFDDLVLVSLRIDLETIRLGPGPLSHESVEGGHLDLALLEACLCARQRRPRVEAAHREFTVELDPARLFLRAECHAVRLTSHPREEGGESRMELLQRLDHDVVGVRKSAVELGRPGRSADVDDRGGIPRLAEILRMPAVDLLAPDLESGLGEHAVDEPLHEVSLGRDLSCRCEHPRAPPRSPFA